MGLWTQPSRASQLSVVHALPSSQFGAGPGVHEPAWQVSVPLHGLASAQDVPFGADPSGGQVVDEPVHVSATSHAPFLVRQTVPDEAKASAGHAALEPVQFSATSHTPADARQTVVLDVNPSAGRAAREPVQC